MLREDGLEKEREKGALAGVYSLRGIPPNRGGGIFSELVGVLAIIRSLRMKRQHSKHKG